MFEVGRTTNLIVDGFDGRWRDGLTAAVREYRRALAYGFSDAEIAEQVARIRQGQENAARAAATRNNGALVSAVEQFLADDLVPTTPESSLARFEAFAPSITPTAVLAALKADAAPLDDPLLRFQGRVAPVGGAEALRGAWDAAVAEPVAAPAQAAATTFAYTDFGTPGTVVADTVEPRTGMHVDPNHASAGSHGHGQGGLCIVAQHVDAQLEAGCGRAYGERGRGHRGHGDRRHVLREERRVAEVLDHRRLEPRGIQGPRIRGGLVEDRAEAALKARAARKRR